MFQLFILFLFAIITTLNTDMVLDKTSVFFFFGRVVIDNDSCKKATVIRVLLVLVHVHILFYHLCSLVLNFCFS